MAKCEHGQYIPEGSTLAEYCGFCNPSGPASGGPTPVLPRSSGDPLNVGHTDARGKCTECGCIRVYSMKECPACDTPYPVDKAAREQTIANAKQSGACPECGSTVHYETKNGWECSDCGKPFTAPKRVQEQELLEAAQEDAELEVPVED